MSNATVAPCSVLISSAAGLLSLSSSMAMSVVAQNDDTNVTLKAHSGELQRCIIDTIHSVAGPPAPARNPVAVKHCPVSHFTDSCTFARRAWCSAELRNDGG